MTNEQLGVLCNAIVEEKYFKFTSFEITGVNLENAPVAALVKTVRSETRFQETLLSVHELNFLCRGVQRKSFDKRELQNIVKKMMKKD